MLRYLKSLIYNSVAELRIYNAYTQNADSGRAFTVNGFVLAQAANAQLLIDNNRALPTAYSATTAAPLWKFTKSGDQWKIESVLRTGMYVSGAKGQKAQLNATAKLWTLDSVASANSSHFGDIKNAKFIHNGTNDWWNGNGSTSTYTIDIWTSAHPYVLYNYSTETSGTTPTTTGPVQTTTIATDATDFPGDAKWYNMTILDKDNNSYYLYYKDGQTYLPMDSTKVTSNKTAGNLWCFTGNATDGYKIYNRAAGVTKILSANSTFTTYQAGGSTYPILTTASSIATTANTTWDITQSTLVTDGWLVSQHGQATHRLNDYNDAKKVAFWTGTVTKGSTIYFTAVDLAAPTVVYDTVFYRCSDENGDLLKVIAQPFAHGSSVTPAAPAITHATYSYNLDTTTFTITENKTFDLRYTINWDEVTLPFTVTTLKTGDQTFPDDAAWYNLRVTGSKYYMIYTAGQANIPLTATTVTSTTDAANEWCFVGNPVAGFRIYNHAAGVGKVLYSADPSTDGNTGGSTYPVLTDLTSIPSGKVYTWDFAAGTVDKAYWVSQSGSTNKSLNNRGSKLAYWTTGHDAGSDVYITSVNGEGPTFVGASKFWSLPNVKLMNKFATDNAQATLTAEGLPDGLTFNAKRNLVEGVIATPGTYTYKIKAANATGVSTTQNVTLVVDSNLISPTPMMAWISWNIYGSDYTEAKIKATADAIVSKGLKDCGWNYINIDDNWQSDSRNADTSPNWNSTTFPGGIPALATYMHDKGLKLGVYSDAATRTCAGEYGSLGYETIDAQTYAKWGCDLLKYDFCSAPTNRTALDLYSTMSKALQATGRPIFFNICEWGERSPWLWAAAAGGNAWRIAYDIRDAWDTGGYSNAKCGAMQALDRNKNLYLYAGPNHFNDMDMLCAGLYGKGGSFTVVSGVPVMNDTEYQSQFSMWAMFAAPLSISFEVTTMNDATKNILTNKEVIAINQDPMGQQCQLISSNNNLEVYMKDLENGDIAVALLNRSASTATITANLSDLFLESGQKYVVRDLWQKAYVDTTDVSISASVASHETKVYRLSKYVSPTVGIATSKAAGFGISTATTAGGIQVSCTGDNGNAKRIYVVDAAGNTIATASGTGSKFELPVSTKGVYVVRAICSGNTQTAKIVK